MARRRKPPAPDLDKPGLPPILQGHLKAGGVRASEAQGDSTQKDEPSLVRSVQPAMDDASRSNETEALSGKATKSPAAVATREHLEGSEQGPS